MLKLTLIQDGKKKEYTAEGFTMRASVMAYELGEEYDQAGTNIPPALRDKCIEFVRVVFGFQFTADELWDGCYDSFYRMIPRMMHAAVLGVSDAMQEFPANPTAAAMESN